MDYDSLIGALRDSANAVVPGGIGGLDAAWTMGKNAAMQIPAGYMGLQQLAHGKGIDAAVDAINRTQALAGGTSTPEGAQNISDLGNAISTVTKPLSDAVDWVGDKSPVTGAALAGAGAVLDPSKLGRIARIVRGGSEAAMVANALRDSAAAAPAAKAAAKASAVVAPAMSADEALRGFGTSKQAREAAAGQRTAALADQTFDRQLGGGARGDAVDPTTFRQLYEDQGQDAVTQAADAGAHLIPNPGGGYVGAPRNVQTGPQLGAMRRSFDDQVNRGIDAINYADPERLGTWYDRAQASQAAMAEPQQLQRGLEQTAAYSAGVAPESELAFRLKHHNSLALGDPEYAYRRAPADMLDRAMADDEPAQLAPKIGEYYNKNDPRQPLDGPFGVNDFRMAQAFGYTDPSGAMATKVSSQMHPFMDAETALAVDRANARGVQGKTDWTGARMQELPWVLGKAEDIYNRGSAEGARFAGGQEGMVKALREANNTIGDVFPKHTMTLTSEAIPGVATQHVPSVLNMPFDDKKLYGDIGGWSTPSPMSAADEGMPASVGAGNRDALTRAQGLYQQPTTDAVGNYVNSLGDVESNPVTMSRPLVDFQKVAGDSAINANTVDPRTLSALRAQEMFRGLIDAQESVAANIPGTMDARKGKTSMLLQRGTPPTQEELGNVSSLLEGNENNLAVAPTDRGLHVMNVADDPDKAAFFAKYLRDMAPQMQDAYPGSKAMPSASQSIYEPVMTDWDGNRVPYGKGEATTKVLDAMTKAPEATATNLGESEEVRKLIAQKALRDSYIGGAAGDVQKSREFFTNADWPRVVKLMRDKGLPAAAAMGALGYSLEGMAAEPSH